MQELPASPNAHQCTFVLLLPRKPAILTRKMGYQPALNQTSSLANAKYIYRTLQWTKSGTYMYIDKFKIYRDSHFVLLSMAQNSLFWRIFEIKSKGLQNSIFAVRSTEQGEWMTKFSSYVRGLLIYCHKKGWFFFILSLFASFQKSVLHLLLSLGFCFNGFS